MLDKLLMICEDIKLYACV